MNTETLRLNRAPTDLAAPLGGVKASGTSTELGPQGLAQYQHLKSIYIQQ